jgi:hypothetical protein
MRRTTLLFIPLLMAAASTHAGFRDASEALGFSGDGKAAFADFNGDGWSDLLAGGHLYRNEEGKKLVNVSEKAGAHGNGIWADCDNDGDTDLFIFSGYGPLFLNQGDGTFKTAELPEPPAGSSQGAAWADLNNDALVDLYVGGYEAWQQAVYPDLILVNEGNGKFREEWRSPSNACYSTRGVTAADFDEDGDPDIYTSNYRLQPNFLWQGDGKLGKSNVAEAFGVRGIPDAVIDYTGGIRYPICGHSIGSAWGDLDEDGHIDLFLGNFSHPPGDQDRPQFLRNRGPAENFHFEDMSGTAGLAWQESFASPALGDYDNDGDLDLYYTTVYGTGSGGIKNYPVLYRNDGDWKFVDVTGEQGLAQLSETYQAAWGDIDNDGDLDLCTNGKLFVNDGNDNHWIKVKLEGDGNNVNRSAIGAQVRIQLGSRILTREVESGTGEGNQNDLTLHFGLGSQTEPVDLQIRWPGGKRQTMDRVKVDQQYSVTYK